MGKIAGNIAWVLMICGSLSFGAAIEMSVVNSDGSPLVQAGVGQPFFLEVTLTGVSHLGQKPEIKGVDQLDIKHAGMRMMAVNGNVSSHHRYELRIDQPGTYTLGPAIGEYKGTKLTSNKVQVIVGNEQINEKDTKAAPILLRLSTDKNRAVVGERITCRLRWYISDPESSLRKFIEQETPVFRRSASRGPRKGTETLDGTKYAYIEWEWDMYPQKAGSHLIPAYGADYDHEIERNHVWGGFGNLLGNYVETKRIYSNAVPLQVDELPPSTRPVQGIGTFSALHVSAKPTVAKQGEGIIVVVEVVGDGDPDGIIFDLDGMPKELKYYESKQMVLDPSMHKNQLGKRFEYIVQGLNVGSWELPPQSFYYYDVAQHAYKELHSTPISITIMPGSKNNIQWHPGDAETKKEDTIAWLHTGPWQQTHHASGLPWWLFILLLFMPILALLYRAMQTMITQRSRGNYRVKRAQNAFRYARERLARYKKKNDVRRLYGIFTELFADRWQLPIGIISESFIEKRLHDIGMQEQQLVAWNKFFSEIAELAFSSHKEDEQKRDLFNQAEQWIQQFEQRL